MKKVFNLFGAPLTAGLSVLAMLVVIATISLATSSNKYSPSIVGNSADVAVTFLAPIVIVVSLGYLFVGLLLLLSPWRGDLPLRFVLRGSAGVALGFLLVVALDIAFQIIAPLPPSFNQLQPIP